MLLTVENGQQADLAHCRWQSSSLGCSLCVVELTAVRSFLLASKSGTEGTQALQECQLLPDLLLPAGHLVLPAGLCPAAAAAAAAAAVRHFAVVVD